MALRRGDDALYFAEKGGRVRALRGGALAQVLDLRGQVSSGSEQGLLGLTFSPAGTHLYVDYTDTAGDTHVVEYRLAGGRADTGTRRELLRIDQPYANHNGGQILFGPDGKLYIGLGDGGAGGDPQGNAQSLGTLLGKILRIDPTPSGGRPYTIPADNPFVGRRGARGEIWAYGLRNPWRFTFDRQTGALWIGDVGQNAWEEIDYAPPTSDGGENYGWDRLEGRHRFEGSPPARHVLPVHEYSLSGTACAVTAGYNYRGGAIPGLRNWFIFADVCQARVKALRKNSGNGTVRDLGLQGSNIVSFGEGAGGELYVLSLNGPVWRIVAA